MNKLTTNALTNKVRRFYEKISFPGYEDIDNVDTLSTKANDNLYVHLLNQQLLKTKRILEIGCGTGQLANFLGLKDRNIVAVDLSFSSLQKAQHFKKNNFVDTVNFAQMNIFSPCLKKNSFDVVISNGVLHHTYNARLAFKIMATFAKPGGIIILGLYNPFGRVFTNIRRKFFNHFGRIDILDFYLRKKDFPESKKKTWFKDQYQNPHETQHTVDEMLSWFKEEKVNFINAVPKITPWKLFDDKDRLFKPTRQGNKLEHFLAQALWVFTQSREGGISILIGKKMS